MDFVSGLGKMGPDGSVNTEHKVGARHFWWPASGIRLCLATQLEVVAPVLSAVPDNPHQSKQPEQKRTVNSWQRVLAPRTWSLLKLED